MNDVLWLAGVLLLPLAGWAVTRLPFVQRLDLGGRVAVALAAGMVAVTVVMYAYSLVGISWTRISVGTALLALAIMGFLVKRGGKAAALECGGAAAAFPFFLATLYAVATARETCADLLYFWGPKAVHFHYAGKIDVEFLKFPHYFLMHPDYPPLLPLVYDWASLVARRFSYWGALYLTAFFLLATVLAFRGIIRTRLDAGQANRFALLLAAILAYGYAIGMVAGAGDPPLVFFETIALAALTFAPDDDRSAYAVAAIALAGAVFLKVEGTAFAAVLLAAFVVTRRRILPAIAVALPPTLLLGSWIVLARHYDFVDNYGKGGKPLHLELTGKVLAITAREASYDALYLPWLAALGPLPFGRHARRALLPLLTGLGVIAYTLFFYLHEPDPSWWIASSAARVLLTALMAFVVASAAASE